MEKPQFPRNFASADEQGLCSIGSIRCSVQSEPRSHRGICGASSGKCSRAQEVPRQLQAGCILLPAPGVPPAEISLSFPPLSHLPGSSGGDLLAFPRVHGFKPCIQIHPAPSKTSLVSGEKHPQTCPQPPQLSLTLHFHTSFSHFFLSGPSSLLSLVPSSSV